MRNNSPHSDSTVTIVGYGQTANANRKRFVTKPYANVNV